MCDLRFFCLVRHPPLTPPSLALPDGAVHPKGQGDTNLTANFLCPFEHVFRPSPRGLRYRFAQGRGDDSKMLPAGQGTTLRTDQVLCGGITVAPVYEGHVEQWHSAANLRDTTGTQRRAFARKQLTAKRNCLPITGANMPVSGENRACRAAIGVDQGASGSGDLGALDRARRGRRAGQDAARAPGTSLSRSSPGCAWMSPEICPPHSISIWP